MRGRSGERTQKFGLRFFVVCGFGSGACGWRDGRRARAARLDTEGLHSGQRRAGATLLARSTFEVRKLRDGGDFAAVHVLLEAVGGSGGLAAAQAAAAQAARDSCGKAQRARTELRRVEKETSAGSGVGEARYGVAAQEGHRQGSLRGDERSAERAAWARSTRLEGAERVYCLLSRV